MQRITIFAFGSRGDVQPYIPLGLRLRQEGYQVSLLAGDEFETFITGYGLDFFPIGFRVRETISESEAARALLESRRGLIRGMQELMQTLQPAVVQMCDSTLKACEQADAVIFSTLGMSAYHAAEKLGIPCLWALTMPAFSRTSAFPSPLFPALPVTGSWINRLTHIMAEMAWQQITGRPFNRWRKDGLDLPPIPLTRWPYGSPLPRLYHVSPAVIPPPPDWDQHAHITGYWFLDHAADYRPPAGLLDFLESGPPPVYIGFGSMAERRTEETTEIILKALALSGQRGLLLTGWAGIGQADLPDEIYKIDAAPHSWLFPRMAAVVHHGGAGTVAAGLRAGIPSIIVPFAGDQPFWAGRVGQIGVGPPPIPRRKLTAERLADAIHIAITTPAICQRAAALGEQIRQEDGIGQAVSIIQSYLSN